MDEINNKINSIEDNGIALPLVLFEGKCIYYIYYNEIKLI